MPAPVASGWSDRRVGLAPTGKAPPCHGARGKPTLAEPKGSGEVAPIADLPTLAPERGRSIVYGSRVNAIASGHGEDAEMIKHKL